MTRKTRSSKRIQSSLISHAGALRTTVARSRRSEVVSQEELRQLELEQDLRLARDLQQGLMLETVPRIPGWEISAVSLPARELGGDLYDFLSIDVHTQGIMIGDVSGKGLPAALRMAVARTVFRSEARRALERSPGLTLAAVNAMLLEEIPHGMVTMLYATIETTSGHMRLANAGHNYPIRVASQIKEVEATGLPLCVAPLDAYTDHTLQLEYGETVLFYTDGVTEAVDQFEEMYGYERLQELLIDVGYLKPRALMARILAEVRTWTGGHAADDITMLLIRRRLQRLIDEMQSVVADIIGAQTTAELWTTLQLHEVETIQASTQALQLIHAQLQTDFGRGIAREVQGQLRPIIEEYRLMPNADT